MAAPVIQASFAAGEVSPHLHGRVDLNKYKIGAAVMRNFMVDYKGGAAKRPGTRFVGKAAYALNGVILVPFTFNNEQTYVLELGHRYMRVVTNGGHVLDGSGNVHTIGTYWDADDLALLKWTQSADTMTFTHPKYPIYEIIRFGHADWRLREFSIGANVNAVTYVDVTLSSSGYIDPAATVRTNMGYGVTGVNPEGGESLMSPIARFENVLDMTAHKVTANISWPRVQETSYYNVWKASVGQGAQIPNGARMGFIGSTIAEAFTDSNILPNFTRSAPLHNDPFAPGAITEVVMLSKGSGYTNDSASITISDSTGYGAKLLPQIRDGYFVGAIVENGGRNYTNPTLTFSGGGAGSSVSSGSGATAVVSVTDGMVSAVTMTAYGSGYADGTIGIITDHDGEGAGAETYTHYYFGAIVGVDVLNGGNGLYVNPTISFADPNVATPGDPDATGYALVGPKTGTYPGAVGYFQQRLLFAATTNRPSTLWGSKPGTFHNFDAGIPVTDGDSFEFTLASQQLNSIKYMIAMPGGLVILTSGGTWQLSGTQQFAPVTPTQVMATPQSNVGCADLQPIVVGFEILFVHVALSTVRNLSYNFFANIYTGTDMTVLSSHLFSGHTIKAWAYSEEPDKVIWLIRDDGKLLSFTFLKEQEVAGWARHETGMYGNFRSVVSVREGSNDAVYFAVDRWNPTVGWYTAIERLESRAGSDPTSVEDAWYLDCALNLPPGIKGPIPIYSGPLSIGGHTTFATYAPFFNTNFIGMILRVGGGKFRVMTILSQYAAGCAEIYPVAESNKILHEEYGYYTMSVQMPHTWDLTWETWTVGGLSHLEGQWVSVFADGNVQTNKLVTSGYITLDAPASKVLVGINYESDLQTLRLESQPTIQGRLKKIPRVTIRVADSRGLWAGMTKDTLTEIKERDPGDVPGRATQLITGDLELVLDPLWDTEGQIWIRSKDPLPANILAVVPEVVMGNT